MEICAINLNKSDLTGEYEDKDFATTRGDARISLQIARNKHTVAFLRTRRFLVDDPDSPHKLSFQLTKPLKGNLTYKKQGTFKFVLQEVTATPYDNHELGIADYYKYFPEEYNQNLDDDIKEGFAEDVTDKEPETKNRKKVWL